MNKFKEKNSQPPISQNGAKNTFLKSEMMNDMLITGSIAKGSGDLGSIARKAFWIGFAALAVSASAFYIYKNRSDIEMPSWASLEQNPKTEQVMAAPEKDGGFDFSRHVDARTLKLYKTYGIVQQTDYENVFRKQDGYGQKQYSVDDVAAFLKKEGMWRYPEWSVETINLELVNKMNFFQPIPPGVLASALDNVRRTTRN